MRSGVPVGAVIPITSGRFQRRKVRRFLRHNSLAFHERQWWHSSSILVECPTMADELRVIVFVESLGCPMGKPVR